MAKRARTPGPSGWDDVRASLEDSAREFLEVSGWNRGLVPRPDTGLYLRLGELGTVSVTWNHPQLPGIPPELVERVSPRSSRPLVLSAGFSPDQRMPAADERRLRRAGWSLKYEVRNRRKRTWYLFAHRDITRRSQGELDRLVEALTDLGIALGVSPESVTSSVLEQGSRLRGGALALTVQADTIEARDRRKAAQLREQAADLERRADEADRDYAREVESAERALHYVPLPSDPLWYALDQPDDATFECDACGGLRSRSAARKTRSDLVLGKLVLEPEAWGRLWRAAADGPIRPSWLQRELGLEYEGALAILERADRLGLLSGGPGGTRIPVPAKDSSSAAQLICSGCYEQRLKSVDRQSDKPAARDPIPAQLRFRVLQRDAFRCQYCGRSAREGATLHLDHVIPVAAGGDTTEDNLITACEACNLGKSANPIL